MSKQNLKKTKIYNARKQTIASNREKKEKKKKKIIQ